MINGFGTNFPKKKNILVVDDEQLICMDLKNLLTGDGHFVVTAQTGTEALRLMQTADFELIFLDLVLPDTDGLEILKQIKELYEDLNVIIITGYPDSDLLNDALELGPISVLKKPINKEQMRRLLKII